ncbi:MAG: DnaD domain protein [Bacilli bacterium]|nr:DnaD domain protein [Bacilli bacterium]
MKGSKLIEFFKDGNIVIPMYFLKRYKDFGIDMNEFIFLMYLYNLGENVSFDPQKYATDLNVELITVMEYVEKLSDKKLIRVEVVKDNNGVRKEILILDDFYNKLTLITMDEAVQEDKNNTTNSTIFDVLEKEFGRKLTPMEFEISKAWLDNGISEELIKEAVKEASFSGVANLRYIDKILYEWGKNGIKNSKDVEEKKKERKEQMEKTSDVDVDLEDIVDWKWFDE